MKSLKESLLYEVSSELQKAAARGIFLFPILKKVGLDEYEDTGKVKEVKIGKGPFYIYQDKYHGDLTIGTVNELYAMIATNYSDYEDFDAKDIIADFKTLYDAAVYILKNYCDVTDEQIKTYLKTEDDDALITAIEGTAEQRPPEVGDDLRFLLDALTVSGTDKEYLKYWQDACELTENTPVELINNYGNITVE